MIIGGGYSNQSIAWTQSNEACNGKCPLGEAFERGCKNAGKPGHAARNELIQLTRSSEPVSPEARQAANVVANGEITEVVKAKGLPPPKEYYRPDPPGPFRSVDTHVTFEHEGQQVTVNFTTGLGHLAPVTPGETEVPGRISLGKENATPLNDRELDGIISALYSRFNEKLTRQEADDLQHVINTAMAVRHKEGSPERVAAQHVQLSQTILQPQTCPGLKRSPAQE